MQKFENHCFKELGASFGAWSCCDVTLVVYLFFHEKSQVTYVLFWFFACFSLYYTMRLCSFICCVIIPKILFSFISWLMHAKIIVRKCTPCFVYCMMVYIQTIFSECYFHKKYQYYIIIYKRRSGWIIIVFTQHLKVEWGLIIYLLL